MVSALSTISMLPMPCTSVASTQFLYGFGFGRTIHEQFSHYRLLATASARTLDPAYQIEGRAVPRKARGGAPISWPAMCLTR